MADLTPPEAEAVIRAAVATLTGEERLLVEHHAVPLRRCKHHVPGVSGVLELPIWVFATNSDRVLGYDETEEEFGSGRSSSETTIAEWFTFGPHLAWAIAGFRSPSV